MQTANLIESGTGNDVLLGGRGNDMYRFGRRSDFDVIIENDMTQGNKDVLEIGADIALEQLWFARNGDHLSVIILGSEDAVTIKNHYLGAQYQIEQFKTADGKTLYADKVDALVTAMASLAPPIVGTNTLPDNYRAVLGPVIAASWS